MGLIQIEGMEFYAYHGHFKEEQIVGNRFLLDLTLETDLNRAAISDNLNDAVNYQQVYSIVKEEMQKKSNLLEHIANRILDALFLKMKGINRATIKVAKMNPPMGGQIRCVSIVMSR